MTGAEIEQERLARAMSYAEFGKWLAEELNKDKPEDEHVKPYSRTRVYEWVHNNVAVPAKVDLVFKDLEIEKLQERVRELEVGIDRDDEEREV